MVELVACIGEDKGILHVKRLIEEEDWTNIILISSGKMRIDSAKKIHYVDLPEKKTIPQLTEFLRFKIKSLIKGTEVGINIYSGSGKEHMATFSALLKLGVGIRLVALTPEGIKEI